MGCGRVRDTSLLLGVTYRPSEGLAPRSKKQLTSDHTLPEVSSPTESGLALVSERIPTSPHLSLSPPTPALQTPVPFPCDVDAGWPWITDSSTKAGDVLIRPVQSLYPELSRARIEPFPEPCRRRHVSLSEHSSQSSAASSPVLGTSGSVLDAATRLQDFRSLIVEMRTSLLDHDCETATVDVGEHGDDEVERLLRLLEDVMRKVRGLAERDTSLGIPLIKVHAPP